MSLFQSEILPFNNVGIASNPFPGIRNFEPEEDYLFFGREKQIQEIQDILAERHFLALIGYSGSGKSSLIKAGIIPSITKGKNWETNNIGWEVIYFRPEENPFKSLAAALNDTFNTQLVANTEDIDNTASFLRQQVKDLQTLYQTYSPQR